MPSTTVVRFGPFSFHLETGELRKGDAVLRLQDQPCRLLKVLVERPGELVTREQIRDLLWPGVTIEYDYALNTAIRKIRGVLRDSADQPRYIETVPKRGYRFIAELEAAPTPLAGNEQPPPAAIASSRRTLWFGLIAAATALSIMGYRLATHVPAIRIESYRQVTTDGVQKMIEFASDGARLYIAEKGVVSTPLSGGPATPVPNSADLTPMGISTSGRELLVLTGRDLVEEDRPLGILTVPAGQYRPIPLSGHAAAWSPDGSRIAFAKGNDLFSARPNGTGLRKIASPGGFARYMRWSPDGRSLLFAMEQGSVEHNSLWQISIDGSGLREVLHGGTSGAWLPDGSGVIAARGPLQASELWFVPRRGDPGRLINGVPGFIFPIIGAQGNSVYATGFISRGQLVRLDPATRRFLPFLNGVSGDGVAFSRDGQWVAWSAWPERTIWRSRADGSNRRQLTFAPAKGFAPRWSPDGRTIAFTNIPSDPSGLTKVMLISSEGGVAREAYSNGEEIALATWSPEGLLAAGGAVWLRHWPPDTTIRIIDPGIRSVSVVPGSRGYWAPKWSPDGRYIWAEHVNSRQFAILDRRTGQWTAPIETGGTIGYGAWSHDSRFVYFNVADKGAIFRAPASGGQPEKIMTVPDFDTADTLGRWFGLAPDDSVLLLRDTSVNEIFALELARDSIFHSAN